MDMKRRMAAVTLAAALGAAAAASAAFTRDGAVIRNSGSTNFPGYTIKVWSDGSTWAVHSNREGTALDAPVTGRVPKELAVKFLTEAREAKEHGATSRPCMKSASFGSRTMVLYHEWTSPDLECPAAGYAVPLGADAHRIISLVKFRPPHRIPLLPNEPRRVPSESPSGQASPTPEPAPSAS